MRAGAGAVIFLWLGPDMGKSQAHVCILHSDLQRMNSQLPSTYEAGLRCYCGLTQPCLVRAALPAACCLQ